MPAFLLKPIVQWGIFILVTVALLGATAWYRHEAVLYEREAKSAAADAARWHKASDDRDAALAALNERVDRQNEHVDALAAAKKRADDAAISAASEALAAQAAINELTLKWRERAHAHPEDVRALGPAACDAYRSLYGATAACGNPGAAAAPGS